MLNHAKIANLRPSLPQLSIGCLALLLINSSHLVFAKAPQEKSPTSRQVRFNQLGVDFLETAEHSLRGFVLQPENPTLFAVDRNWLYETFPGDKGKFQKLERERVQPILDELDQRLEEWIAESAGKEELVRFLEGEQLRIRESNRLPEIDTNKFLVLQFPTKNVELRVQPSGRRRVGALAFQFGLDNPSTRTVADLKKELDRISKDWASEAINLARGLPAVHLTDREWEIRKSITEFAVLKKLEFQGEGEFLVEASEQPDMNQLLTRMLKSSREDSISRIGRELGIPEFTVPATRQNHWKEKVIQKAERADCRSILVKRIVPSSVADEVLVEAVFLGKLSGTWETISSQTGTAQLSAQSSADLDDLKSDPQIRKILELTQSLGLGSQSLLDQAFRKGAATQQATRIASDKIDRVIESNSFQLDWPLILK